MRFYDWKDEYSVGIPEIDGQHHKVIELINEVMEAIRDNRVEYVIREVIADLERYAKYHFRLEENLFRDFVQEVDQLHYGQHRQFERKVGELSAHISSGDYDVAEETLTFLLDWFRNHIQRTDKDHYRELLAGRSKGEIESLLAEWTGP
ncbi:MAG TPA: bacteriohemerythrin [Rectinemataceae bacterium]|nr:bacteriohemerythrin [Rectinemataceae bacterium]